MKRNVFVFLFFIVISLVLFWPIFLGKVNLNGNLLVSFYAPYGENLPFKNTGWDQLRIYFPFYKFTFDQYRNFSVPLWNPYAFAGHLHGADFQSAVFYPLNIFGLFLPQIEFWHFLRITPQILAAFFTFLFLKNRKLSLPASVFGALTFGFSPFILTWGEEVVMSPHSIVFLPLMLWAVDRYLDAANKKYLAVFSVAWAFSLLGGYIQTSIYVAIVTFAYLVYRFFTSKRKLVPFFNVGVFWFLGTLVAAVQLVPSAELFFNSGRSTIPLKQVLFAFLLPIKSLFTYLSPDFFGNPATYNTFRDKAANYYEAIMFVGVSPLVFGALAVARRKVNHELLFWLILGLISLSTTLDLPTSRLFLNLPIPFLSTSIANRILFVPAFCIAVLASYGFEMWLFQKNRDKTMKVLVVFGAIYAVITVYLLGVKAFGLPYFSHLTIDRFRAAGITFRNNVVPIVVFVASAVLIVTAYNFKSKKLIFGYLILAVLVLHTFYFAAKYFTFNDRKYVFPSNEIWEYLSKNQGLYRSWGVGAATLTSNFATQYEVFSPEGYDSLNNRAYGEFTYAMQGYDVGGFYLRSDAGLGGLEKASASITSEVRRRLVNMVGVKYLVADKADSQFLLTKNFKLAFEGKKFNVLENEQVIPRVFLASAYEGPPDLNMPGETEKERKTKEKLRRPLIFQKLTSPDFDVRNVVVLEKPAPISPQFDSAESKSRAEVTSYKPTKVNIHTSSKAPKLLFISDNYFDGWKAKVDGDDTEVLRADYTFKAVPLTPGEHEVEFYYDPLSFKVGLVISLAALGTLTYLVVKSKGKNQKLKV